MTIFYPHRLPKFTFTKSRKYYYVLNPITTARASWTVVLECLVVMFHNKKVLLCEHKRHTARRVASARYAALSHGWRGVPLVPPTIQTWSGGYPPPSRPGMGYPTQTWDGVPPPSRPGVRYPPPPSRPRTGYPPSRPGWGYPGYSPPHHPDLGWGTWPRPEMGYPPPRPGMGTPPPRPEMGYPPPRPGTGYPPDLRWGTPLPRPGMGYPSLPRPGTGYPPPPRRKCGQSENITSRHSGVTTAQEKQIIDS